MRQARSNGGIGPGPTTPGFQTDPNDGVDQEVVITVRHQAGDPPGVEVDWPDTSTDFLGLQMWTTRVARLIGGKCEIVAVMIELADVITSLRSELDTARMEGTGKDLRFELGSVELEVSVAVEKNLGGGAKVRFWVVELGADGKLGTTSTQRVKLTLNPKLTASAAAADATILSERSAFVHGPDVDGEE